MAPPPDAAFWAAARGEGQRPRAAAPPAADPRARKRAKKVSAKAQQAAAADVAAPAPAQRGGLGGLGSYAPPGAPAPGRITIRVLGPRALEEETCVVNSTTALRELFEAHATRKGVAGFALRFSVANLSSPALTGNETPASLGLVDGSEIIVARCAPPAPALSGGLGGAWLPTVIVSPFQRPALVIVSLPVSASRGRRSQAKRSASTATPLRVA